MTTCHGEDGAPATAAQPTAARLSVSYGYAHTVLSFDGQVRADFSRHAVSVAGERPIGSRGVALLGAGGIADGTLDTGESYSMGPGWLFFAAYGHRLLDERGAWPFLLGTVSIGATAARTASARGESAHFTAYDARAGLTAGKVFGPATPYVAARVFGGPVLWTQHGQHLTGTDKYHYQPAVGLVLAKAPFDVSFEWAFAGEQALTAGAGMSF